MGWREKGREGKIYMRGREEGRKGGKEKGGREEDIKEGKEGKGGEEGIGCVSVDVFSIVLLDIKQKCLYLTIHHSNV